MPGRPPRVIETGRLIVRDRQEALKVGSKRAGLHLSLHGIAAYLPFYPPCNFELVGEMDVVDAPIRAFHGAKDEWNPLPRCRDYIERLAAAGHDAQITVYPDARHAFDHINSPAYNEMSDAQTSRTCMRREENGRLMNVATGKPFLWRDECVQLGPPVQYNDAANSQAQAAVKEFLTKLFHLN